MVAAAAADGHRAERSGCPTPRGSCVTWHPGITHGALPVGQATAACSMVYAQSHSGRGVSLTIQHPASLRRRDLDPDPPTANTPAPGPPCRPGNIGGLPGCSAHAGGCQQSRPLARQGWRQPRTDRCLPRCAAPGTAVTVAAAHNGGCKAWCSMAGAGGPARVILHWRAKRAMHSRQRSEGDA